MDARSLDLPDESFDAVYLPLIVTVAPDGQRVLAEAARVTKPGARLVILDRFWPEGRPRPAALRRAGALLGSLATYIDRRFSEIHAGAPDLRVLDDQTRASGGFLQLITLEKPG
ncbi:MAG: methyltransferase domain-containing protein, partial [Actinomycetota bacterium]|nr:methyltransferase domain-containing protein [Actinomycetota bacterium]